MLSSAKNTPDPEVSQWRAKSAMAALEALLDLVPDGEMLDIKHVRALVAVTHDTARGAMSPPRVLPFANDQSMDG